MSAFRTVVVAAVFAMSASAASAQPLTNGPNGNGTNAVDSQNPAVGINARKTSRAIVKPSSSMYKSGRVTRRMRKR